MFINIIIFCILLCCWSFTSMCTNYFVKFPMWFLLMTFWRLPLIFSVLIEVHGLC